MERPETCDMCGTRPMLPIPNADGEDSSFTACPNCDSPLGKMPVPQDPM